MLAAMIAYLSRHVPTSGTIAGKRLCAAWRSGSGYDSDLWNAPRGD